MKKLIFLLSSFSHPPSSPSQCLKYKTHSSIILNRFESLTLNLLTSMSNPTPQLVVIPQSSTRSHPGSSPADHDEDVEMDNDGGGGKRVGQQGTREQSVMPPSGGGGEGRVGGDRSGAGGGGGGAKNGSGKKKKKGKK